MKYPDFIIAGAAKSGTSSLCNHLAQHKDIFITQPKELNFFNSWKEDKELEKYYTYFSEANGKKAGEGSVSYMYYSNTSAPQLKSLFPDLKLIFMLRNPVQRYYSDFWFNVNRGAVVYKKSLFDDLLFKNICLADPGNKKMDYRDLLIEKGLYAKHMKEFYKYFDPSQIHIIFFEDFTKNTQEVLSGVFEFLEVEYSNTKSEIEVKNKTSYPGKLAGAYIFWKKAKRFLPQGFIVRHRAKFIRVKGLFFTDKKPNMSESAKKELLNIYFDSIVELEELTNRDLSQWKK